MTEPVWIPIEVIYTIQNQLLARFGGLGGVRDDGLLASALNRPKELFNYGKPDLFDLAGVYAEGVVKNHPFVDGNKRVGFMAAYTFLGINGQRLEASEEEAVLQTLSLAAGEIGAKEYAAWLRRSCSSAQ